MKGEHKRSTAAASVSAAAAAAAALILTSQSGRTSWCHASSATDTPAISSRNYNKNLLRRNPTNELVTQRRMTEYDGKIKLGPVHEEIDIYEQEEKPAPSNEDTENDDDENSNKAVQDEQDLEEETAKLKADLAKLEDLDAQLKDEIAAESPTATAAVAAAPPPSNPEDEEITKLKADLAKLEDLDDELKDQISSPDEQEVNTNTNTNTNDVDAAEELREEMDKLKDDLSYLQNLDSDLKDEITATEEKPSKAEDIAKLHEAEQSITDNPHQAPINIDERDAIEIATVFENAVAECNDMMAASQPPHAQQRVEDAAGNGNGSGKTEAELEVTYEEACCVPPLYSDFCTPTQPREWCDMRLACLEADRLRTVFVAKIQVEIDAAQSACNDASAAAGGKVTERNVEMKCCMPPYDVLLPECIDRGERAKRRVDNKCDDGLEKCVEVKMLIDLRDDTVGMYPGDEDAEGGTSAPSTGAASGNEVAPGDAEEDAFKPEVTDYHVSIVDNKDDKSYAYSPHIGGREEGGGEHLGYKKKEEFHKADQFSLGPKTASMGEDNSSAEGPGLYGMAYLWMISTSVAGMALIIFGV